MGKHPRIRTDESLVAFATTDAATIEQWFRWWPHMNLGVVCSPATGILGFDVDFSKGGVESMMVLEPILGPTLMAHSSDGYHLYYKHPGMELPDFHNLMPGISMRARAAYLIAPPSIHASGAVYRWEDEKAEIREISATTVNKLISLLASSRGVEYTDGPLVYPVPGQKIVLGWKPSTSK